ncbi:MAG: DUF4912 domain-containing protein [Candidatus Omnitrophica bacterium]|nr:DUF4912 domain-containing protein [Candidatus Omnitrophota bacterium]
MAEQNGFNQDQTQVEIAKFKTFRKQKHISRKIDLPWEYGKDRIVAMVRDPWWIFAYWEITPQREKAVREEIEKKGQHFERSVIRVYDITGLDSLDTLARAKYFDITLKNMARNWYVDVGAPERRVLVEIGIVSREGGFYALARSNIVNTPRFGISDMLDEEWMLSEEEYMRLFGASCGIDVVGKSSLELQELFHKRIEEWISSGGVFSLASHMLR